MPKKQSFCGGKTATVLSLEVQAKQDKKNDATLLSKVDSSSIVEKSAYKSCSALELLQYYSTERAINVEDRLNEPLFSKGGDVLFAKDVMHAESLQRRPPKPDKLTAAKPNATVEVKRKGCVHQNWNGVEADLLLWKLCDYNISPYHAFSSSTPEDLRSRIEKALVANDIEFSLEEKFSYRCIAVCDFSSVKFMLRVAKLQSPCQKIVGETHVVEFTKCSCSSPMAWQAVFVSLANSLKDVLNFKNQNLQTSHTECKLLGKLSSSRCDQSMVKEDLGNLMSFLLEFITDHHQAGDGVGELASLVAIFSNDYEDEHEDSLKVSDVQKLLSLLNHRSVDVRRSVCIVIRNVARAGLFRDLSDLEKEDIIRCLSRCVQSIGPNEMLTNRLKREAVEALGVMQGFFFPKNDSTRDLTRKTLQACAGSCDIRLSACATEALTNFRKKDISTG